MSSVTTRQPQQRFRREIVPAPTTAEAETPQVRITWQRALDAWLDTLERGGTPATYASAVRAFFTTTGAPDLGDLDVDTLYAYAGALRQRTAREASPANRLAPATVNLKLAALRSFLAFCRRRAWLPQVLPTATGGTVPTVEAIPEALKGIRAHVQRPYHVLEGGELEALLYAAAHDPYDPERALALLTLAYGAGLRVAELVALDVGDLHAEGGFLFADVREGKGRKQRQVPLSPDVFALQMRYLAASGRALHRSADQATPLFLSRKVRGRAGRLTTRQARRIVVATAERAGLDLVGRHITPHALRHSYAMRLLLDGAPLSAVSKLLGHSSIAVTGRYTDHLATRDLAKYAPGLGDGSTSGAVNWPA